MNSIFKKNKSNLIVIFNLQEVKDIITDYKTRFYSFKWKRSIREKQDTSRRRRMLERKAFIGGLFLCFLWQKSGDGAGR